MPRRFLSFLPICGLLLASLLLHAGAAYGAPGDPEAGSPSEGIYELPLEKGREDAAPGSGGTTAPGGGGGEGEGGGTSPGSEGGEEESSSNYRSENNFGSSSQVPGAGDAAVGAPGTNGKGDGSGSASAGVGTGGDAGGAAGDSGEGRETKVAQTSAEVPDTGNTSVAGNLALLAAILVLAAAVGVVARRRLRTRQRPS